MPTTTIICTFFIATSDERKIRNKKKPSKKGNEKNQTRNAFIFSRPISLAMTTWAIYDLPYITHDRSFIIIYEARAFVFIVFGIILLRSIEKWLYSSSTRGEFFFNLMNSTIFKNLILPTKTIDFHIIYYEVIKR